MQPERNQGGILRIHQKFNVAGANGRVFDKATCNAAGNKSPGSSLEVVEGESIEIIGNASIDVERRSLISFNGILGVMANLSCIDELELCEATEDEIVGGGYGENQAL